MRDDPLPVFSRFSPYLCGSIFCSVFLGLLAVQLLFLSFFRVLCVLRGLAFYFFSDRLQFQPVASCKPAR